MIGSLVRRLDARPFGQQLLLLALVLDPVGFFTGFLAAPMLEIDPLMGGVYGLVVASTPMSLWILRHSQQHA